MENNLRRTDGIWVFAKRRRKPPVFYLSGALFRRRNFMAIKKQTYEVGASLEMLCSSCDTETSHTVETVTKQGQISKAVCDTCASESTFRRGVKTSIAMSKGKTASPYDRTRKYRKGQAMMHSVFGQGEVTAVIEPQKIDVLFGDQTRRLIHAQA